MLNPVVGLTISIVSGIIALIGAAVSASLVFPVLARHRHAPPAWLRLRRE